MYFLIESSVGVATRFVGRLNCRVFSARVELALGALCNVVASSHIRLIAIVRHCFCVWLACFVRKVGTNYALERALSPSPPHPRRWRFSRGNTWIRQGVPRFLVGCSASSCLTFCKFVVGAARFVVGVVHPFAPLGYGPGPRHYRFLSIFLGVIGSICPGNQLSWLRTFVIFFSPFGKISWSYFKLGDNRTLCIPQYGMCCNIRPSITRVTWRWIAYTVEEWHIREMAMKMAVWAETCRHECKTNKLDPGVTEDGAVRLSLAGLWTVPSVEHTPKDATFRKMYVSTTGEETRRQLFS